jgi:hypothetical protein
VLLYVVFRACDEELDLAEATGALLVDVLRLESAAAVAGSAGMRQATKRKQRFMVTLSAEPA